MGPDTEAYNLYFNSNDTIMVNSNFAWTPLNIGIFLINNLTVFGVNSAVIIWLKIKVGSKN